MYTPYGYFTLQSYPWDSKPKIQDPQNILLIFFFFFLLVPEGARALLRYG